MKKVFLLFALTGSLFFLNSCEEKTTGEKVKDDMEEVGDDIEDGVEDAGDEVEDAVE